MASTKPQENSSERDYAMSKGEKTSYPWYLTNIDKHLIPMTKDLLEKYSNIPPDQQSKHIHEIRDQAWAIRSYPCTGLGIFLNPLIASSPAYSTILKRLNEGGILLDIGCFIGHDIRRLIFDGAPGENIYGLDIVSHWDVGYALFNDQDKLKAHFIEGDILLATQNSELKPLLGNVDIISIQAVLHQWNWEQQVDCGKQLVALSKPGSLVVGHQIGNVRGHEVTIPKSQTKQWFQSPETFVQLWEQIGQETGTQWETQVVTLTWEEFAMDPNDAKWMAPGSMPILFVVTRIQ